MTDESAKQLDYGLSRLETLDQETITSLVEEGAIRLDNEVDRHFIELSKHTEEFISDGKARIFAELLHGCKVSVMGAVENVEKEAIQARYLAQKDIEQAQLEVRAKSMSERALMVQIEAFQAELTQSEAQLQLAATDLKQKDEKLRQKMAKTRIQKDRIASLEAENQEAQAASEQALASLSEQLRQREESNAQLESELQQMVKVGHQLDTEVKAMTEKLELAQRREEHYRHIKQMNEQLRGDIGKLDLINQELVSYVGFLERDPRLNSSSAKQDLDRSDDIVQIDVASSARDPSPDAAEIDNGHYQGELDHKAIHDTPTKLKSAHTMTKLMARKTTSGKEENLVYRSLQLEDIIKRSMTIRQQQTSFDQKNLTQTMRKRQNSLRLEPKHHIRQKSSQARMPVQNQVGGSISPEKRLSEQLQEEEEVGMNSLDEIQSINLAQQLQGCDESFNFFTRQSTQQRGSDYYERRPTEMFHHYTQHLQQSGVYPSNEMMTVEGSQRVANIGVARLSESQDSSQDLDSQQPGQEVTMVREQIAVAAADLTLNNQAVNDSRESQRERSEQSAREQTGTFVLGESPPGVDGRQRVQDIKNTGSGTEEQQMRVSYRPAQSLRLLKQTSDFEANVQPTRTPPAFRRQATADGASCRPSHDAAQRKNTLKTNESQKEARLRNLASRAMKKYLMSHSAQLIDPDQTCQKQTFHKVLANRQLFSMQAPNYAVFPTALL